jgi:hypothetical protein
MSDHLSCGLDGQFTTEIEVHKAKTFLQSGFPMSTGLMASSRAESQCADVSTLSPIARSANGRSFIPDERDLRQ